MQEEHKGLALVILGVVSVIAVVGLVMMFSSAKTSTGALFTSATNGQVVCPVATAIGEPQWFPVLAGPGENEAFLAQWTGAGYDCHPAAGQAQIDEYSLTTWCCRNPAGDPQVSARGPVPLETRQPYGVPVGQGVQYPAGQQPRVGP